jgi:hypothetical protein
MLNVTNKSFMLSVVMLNAVMQNVIILYVEAPLSAVLSIMNEICTKFLFVSCHPGKPRQVQNKLSRFPGLGRLK